MTAAEVGNISLIHIENYNLDQLDELMSEINDQIVEPRRKAYYQFIKQMLAKYNAKNL